MKILLPDESSPSPIRCPRCARPMQVAARRTEEARLLRHAAEPRGYCVDCAVTEFLKNTYPVNMIVEESEHGASMLLSSHVQEQFAEIMRAGLADAVPDEIDWERVVRNWDLPFERSPRPSATNPHTPTRRTRRKPAESDELQERLFADRSLQPGDLVIRSFEQLNELEPGLGDEFKRLLASDLEQ